MTIRNQAIGAVLTLLNDPSRPGGVPLSQRGYLFAISSTDLPAILVYPGEEDDTHELDNGVTKHDLALHIEVRAKSSTGVSADENAETCLAWVAKALGGRRNTGSAGPFHFIYENRKVWDYEQMEHGVCIVRVLVGVKYQTKFNDAEAWA